MNFNFKLFQFILKIFDKISKNIKINNNFIIEVNILDIQSYFLPE